MNSKRFIDALTKEFKLQLKRTSAAWLDAIDGKPDPGNPEHWNDLYYDKKHNVYFNFKWFPTILIELVHNDTILGKIVVRSDVTVEDVIWYSHNILDP